MHSFTIPVHNGWNKVQVHAGLGPFEPNQDDWWYDWAHAKQAKAVPKAQSKAVA